MSRERLPRPQAPIAGVEPPTREWWDYLSQLGTSAESSAQADDLEQLAGRVTALEDAPSATGELQGPLSVEVVGVLANGLAQVRLRNDQASPAADSWYGVDSGGQLGYVPIPENLKEISGLTGSGYAFRNGAGDWSLANPTGGGISVTFDGSGSAITASAFCDLYIPNNLTITKATLLADVVGSIQIDIRAASYAAFPTFATICGSTPPTLSSADKTQDATLTGWITAISAGTVLRFFVVSCAGIGKAHLMLERA